MPTYESYKSEVRDRLWLLAEASTAVSGLVRVGNRLKLSTQWGWLKSLMTNKRPADFPFIAIDEGRFIHGTFADDPVLAEEGAAFVAGGGSWGVAATYVYTARVIDLPDQRDRLNALDEALKVAWLAGGPRLGRTDVSPTLPPLGYVRPPWGPMSGRGPEETQRDPMANGQRVIVTQIDLPVTIELDGQTLLAGTRET